MTYKSFSRTSSIGVALCYLSLLILTQDHLARHESFHIWLRSSGILLLLFTNWYHSSEMIRLCCMGDLGVEICQMHIYVLYFHLVERTWVPRIIIFISIMWAFFCRHLVYILRQSAHIVSIVQKQRKPKCWYTGKLNGCHQTGFRSHLGETPEMCRGWRHL